MSEENRAPMSEEERAAQDRATLWYLVGQGALDKPLQDQDRRMLRGTLRENELETLKGWFAHAHGLAREIQTIYEEIAFGRYPDAERLGEDAKATDIKAIQAKGAKRG